MCGHLFPTGDIPYQTWQGTDGAGQGSDRQVIRADRLKRTGKTACGNAFRGERQRAWIAMTICQEPEILILDEPTTYLDISYQVEVLELVQYLNRKLGITIVMVLHDLNLAAKYSDYLYALKDGGIYARGTAGEILTEEKPRENFFNRGERQRG